MPGVVKHVLLRCEPTAACLAYPRLLSGVHLWKSQSLFFFTNLNLPFCGSPVDSYWQICARSSHRTRACFPRDDFASCESEDSTGLEIRDHTGRIWKDVHPGGSCNLRWDWVMWECYTFGGLSGWIFFQRMHHTRCIWMVWCAAGGKKVTWETNQMKELLIYIWFDHQLVWTQWNQKK